MAFDRSFVIVITLLAFMEWSSFSPFKTFGFYCHDPKLEFENKGDTISVNLLLFVSFVVPYFIFLIIEWCLNNDVSSKSIIKTSWFQKANIWYLRYLHGLCFTFLLTDVMKIVAGEPRPHFFETCRPLEAVNCTTGKYFPKFTCTSTSDPMKVSDSYKSFPSGHASFSFYSATFLAIYLTDKVKTNSLFLLNFLHFLCVSWAVTCAITRITDHRHHWWDVLFGCILGVSIFLYVFYYRWDRKWSTRKFDAENSKHFESKFSNSN